MSVAPDGAAVRGGVAQTWAQEIHKGFHYCASEPWIQSQGLQRTKPGGNLALYALNWFEPRGREAAGTPDRNVGF